MPDTMQVARTYLKIAIGAGLPFGLVMAALALAAAAVVGSSPTRAVALGFGAGAAFGLAMSALLGTAQVLADRKARRRDTIEGDGVRVLSTSPRTHAMPARYTQTLAVDLPLEDAYAECLQSADAFEFARVERTDAAHGIVELKTAMSLKSWGERVIIELEEIDARTTSIEITSRSRLRYTLADYGKNAENVQRVAEWIAGRVSRAASHA
jgi:hypothetical protein